MTRTAGAFCRVGLATSDPAAAKAFYTRLFGWQSEDLPAGKLGTVTTLRRDGSEVAILYRQTREARGPRGAPLDAVRLGRARRRKRAPRA